MRFIKNNIWTFCLVAVFTLMAFAGDASAQSVMSTAKEKALNVFTEVKKIFFVVGGFGLIAVAFTAIVGKIKWTWFAGLAVGLAIVAAAGSIVTYATGDSTGQAGFNDSFDSATNG